MNLHKIDHLSMDAVVEYMKVAFPKSWQWKHENGLLMYRSSNVTTWNTMQKDEFVAGEYLERTKQWMKNKA